MTKVLLVDENKDVCSIYMETLRCAGYTIDCTNDGESALAEISKKQPDRVLLDVLLPKVNGLHILDMIQKDYTNKKTKVVVFTDVADSTIREKALKAGASDYIVKSETNMTELLQRIDRVLS